MSRSGGEPRRYPTADLYEERQRDFHRGPRRSTREFDELEIDINESRGEPAFLREDYGRSQTAGQLVVRERRERSVERAPPRPREVDREEIIIREDRERARPRPRQRSIEREEITVRRGERERPRRAPVKEDELDISIRHEHDEPPRRRQRPREIERDEIQIRRSEADLHRASRGPDDFPIRRGTMPPRAEVDKEEITIRHEHDDRGGRGRGNVSERDEITIRHRSQSRGPRENLPPPRDLVARETEEFVIRRRKPRTPSPSPSPPPPPRRFDREEIIIRRTEERSPTPPPPPPPPPEPEPEPIILQPIIRPPIHQQIHQEIITHHRHIDHGVERARSPSPLPLPPRTPTPPPPEPKIDTLEIDIHRRRDGRGNIEEDITIEHEHSRARGEHEHSRVRSERGVELSRPRSLSQPPRRRHHDHDLDEEAEYYNRKAMERAYVGEAHDGATNDWAIVDVPPGTERVKMDGAGGSSQEISWQRYNGVRRSKFLAGNREFDTGFGMPEHHRAPEPLPAPPPASTQGPPARIRNDMWTEVTKDLVIKEAIEAMGYEFEETEFFYYVMEYLRYEDVLQLVEISDEIRRDRRRRIREIEWEREDLRHRHRHYDDRTYEHEVIVDRRRIER